jgi:hypothetical protein
MDRRGSKLMTIPSPWWPKINGHQGVETVTPTQRLSPCPGLRLDPPMHQLWLPLQIYSVYNSFRIDYPNILVKMRELKVSTIYVMVKSPAKFVRYSVQCSYNILSIFVSSAHNVRSKNKSFCKVSPSTITWKQLVTIKIYLNFSWKLIIFLLQCTLVVYQSPVCYKCILPPV